MDCRRNVRIVRNSTWRVYLRTLFTWYCLALTTICVGIGYLIMRGGAGLLKAADRIPTEEEDTEALEANLDTNK